MVGRKRYVFYHMCHPNTPGPVEEGVITELHPSYYSRYTNADRMTASVQNTGDFTITITGGFINGKAAINATGNLNIEKGANKQVTLYFPAAELLEQKRNGIPFQVKLITSRGNIIAYPEPYFIPWSENGSILDPVITQEQGNITFLQFADGGEGNDTIVATVQNIGDFSIAITSGLVNGRATTIVPDTTTIPKGGEQDINMVLPTDTLVDATIYQVVLITSQSDAIAFTSKYSQP